MISSSLSIYNIMTRQILCVATTKTTSLRFLEINLKSRWWENLSYVSRVLKVFSCDVLCSSTYALYTLT